MDPGSWSKLPLQRSNISNEIQLNSNTVQTCGVPTCKRMRVVPALKRSKQKGQGFKVILEHGKFPSGVRLLTVPGHEILKVTGRNKADLSLPSVPTIGPTEDHRVGRQGGLVPSGSPFHFS